MTRIAARHRRQKSEARLFRSFDAGVTGGTFELVGFDVLFVAESHLAFGRGVGLVFVGFGVAVHAVALDFGAVTFGALRLFRQHQIVRILAGLRGSVTLTAFSADIADMLLVGKFDGRPLLDRIVPRGGFIRSASHDHHQPQGCEDDCERSYEPSSLHILSLCLLYSCENNFRSRPFRVMVFSASGA